MLDRQPYQGARWIRADFHLHSPGIHSFSFPAGLSPQDRDELVEQYVAQLRSQNIEIAAITDYQQIRTEWFVPIRDAAKKAGICVYPGVELSFGGGIAGKQGLHVLAIFPCDADPEVINRAIDKLLDGDSIEPLLNDRGEPRDLKPKNALAECLKELRQEHGCLFIFAHPMEERGATRHPTLAGLLCFTLAAAPSDAKTIDGTLFDMLEDATRFLRIHLRRPHFIHGFEPEEHIEIPDEALRELLINALVHRDYTVASPIRLLIFDDRVEIRTPGGLPNTVTIVRQCF